MNNSENRYSTVFSDLGIIGHSNAFQSVLEGIRQVAPTNITVLITGESGTGKDIAAQALHNLSPRKNKPMLSVNCGAIPEGILESELFGHEKGSFTGAGEMRKGYFESADGGTLFLDEIGEMPVNLQVKLLRVLETREFMRVGGVKTIHSDVRVLAATNKDLSIAVSRNEFRSDLFYRLNAVHLDIPPLRKRVEDIRPLALHFAEQTCIENNIDFDGFEDEAFDVLETHNWPGNIRELRNVIERIIVLEKGRRIDAQTLRLHIGSIEEPSRNLPVLSGKTADQAERELIYRALLDIRIAIEELKQQISGMDTPYNHDVFSAQDTHGLPVPPEDLRTLERDQIEKALNYYHGNRRKAAKALKIGERTLYRKLKEYGLEDSV